jgi:hypothetical protein
MYFQIQTCNGTVSSRELRVVHGPIIIIKIRGKQRGCTIEHVQTCPLHRQAKTNLKICPFKILIITTWGL